MYCVITCSGMTAIATYLLTKEIWNSGAGLFAACFIAVGQLIYGYDDWFTHLQPLGSADAYMFYSIFCFFFCLPR